MFQSELTLAAMTAAGDKEAKLIQALKSSDSDRKAKADACRELAQCATQAAVPVLAGMLADKDMSHMARYALETIDDPSVDKALRDALGTTKGKLLAGVIGSVGVRKDAKAVPELSAILKRKNEVVAGAAARALGSIATPDAVKALEGALQGASKPMTLMICEGLLRSAEALAKAGKASDAKAIYSMIGKLDAPHQIKTAARLGMQ